VDIFQKECIVSIYQAHTKSQCFGVGSIQEAAPYPGEIMGIKKRLTKKKGNPRRLSRKAKAAARLRKECFAIAKRLRRDLQPQEVDEELIVPLRGNSHRRGAPGYADCTKDEAA
jgi:hypothetical protein